MANDNDQRPGKRRLPAASKPGRSDCETNAILVPAIETVFKLLRVLGKALLRQRTGIVSVAGGARMLPNQDLRESPTIDYEVDATARFIKACPATVCHLASERL